MLRQIVLKQKEGIFLRKSIRKPEYTVSKIQEDLRNRRFNFYNENLVPRTKKEIFNSILRAQKMVRMFSENMNPLYDFGFKTNLMLIYTKKMVFGAVLGLGWQESNMYP